MHDIGNPDHIQETSFQRTFQEVMKFWVVPEIERRQEAGALPKPAPLRRAQILFFAEGRSPLVRINEEVKILARGKLKPGVSKRIGDAIYEDEVECYIAAHN